MSFIVWHSRAFEALLFISSWNPLNVARLICKSLLPDPLLQSTWHPNALRMVSMKGCGPQLCFESSSWTFDWVKYHLFSQRQQSGFVTLQINWKKLLKARLVQIENRSKPKQQGQSEQIFPSVFLNSHHPANWEFWFLICSYWGVRVTSECYCIT